MKRFLIHVSTYWCGMDNTFRAEAESTYYSFSIEECEDDEEWNEYSGEIYGEDKVYNREDLKAKDVARLISIWEGEAGESFTDYCNFSREADKNFLLFLAEKYPILYDYHCKVAGNDWLDHCIQYVVDHCGEYLTQWVPAEEYHLSWQLEEMAIYPLADFILKDDGAWEDFVDFFTSEKETASGTPYIDCYDIRELFENGDV